MTEENLTVQPMLGSDEQPRPRKQKPEDIRLVIPVPLETRQAIRRMAMKHQTSVAEMVRSLIAVACDSMGEPIPTGLLKRRVHFVTTPRKSKNVHNNVQG